MNNKVKIKVLCDFKYFINYLITHSIKYSNLERKNIYYYLIVDIEDYKTISRRYDTNIIRYYGIKYYINILNYNKYLIISFFICLLLLKLLCNTIFEIDIKTDNIELKNNIIDVLKKYDISVNKKKKTYEELSIIKEKVLNEISNIEWIEINNIGCKYIININEKIKNDIVIDNDLSDIIASKDGNIKHIIVYNGTKLKEENEYVRKGEVIISGALYKDEELINYEHANGVVYAEVWYISKINIPFEYTSSVKTNNKINHYYIEIFNKKLSLTGKYPKDNMEIKEKCIIDKPYLIFKLYKEELIEYNDETILLSEKEAIDIALEKSDNKLNSSLDENEYIISKNILKKEVNSSKMYIEVFYKVYENIGITSYIKDNK